jgi:hypothetical protein
MSDSTPRENPEAQPASAGSPQRPLKQIARGLDGPAPEEPHIDIPDRIILRELAAALQQKQFKIVADAMGLGRFMLASDPVDFDTAASIAVKYGFHARHASQE